MPANTTPIFPLTPNTPIQTAGAITAANTNQDGTGTLVTVFTAGANGSRIDRLRCKATGTNVASLLNVFINNGSANSAATTSKIGSLALPATTTANASDYQPDLDYIMDLPLPASYRIMVCIATAVAGGWIILGIGGDY